MTDGADLETPVRRMIERGSTTTRADIPAVMEDAIGACESMLLVHTRGNVWTRNAPRDEERSP